MLYQYYMYEKNKKKIKNKEMKRGKESGIFGEA
jgi:hypothetical protein